MIPLILYLVILSDVGVAYVVLMKTLKLVFLICVLLLFPVVIVCFLVYNAFLNGLIRILILGVYYLYIAVTLSLFIYLVNYLMFMYDSRLVLLGIFPIFFIFFKMCMIRILSLLFFYIILLVTMSYL